MKAQCVTHILPSPSTDTLDWELGPATKPPTSHPAYKVHPRCLNLINKSHTAKVDHIFFTAAQDYTFFLYEKGLNAAFQSLQEKTSPKLLTPNLLSNITVIVPLPSSFASAAWTQQQSWPPSLLHFKHSQLLFLAAGRDTLTRSGCLLFPKDQRSLKTVDSCWMLPYGCHENRQRRHQLSVIKSTALDKL